MEGLKSVKPEHQHIAPLYCVSVLAYINTDTPCSFAKPESYFSQFITEYQYPILNTITPCQNCSLRILFSEICFRAIYAPKILA